MSILCGTDLSPASAGALDVAIAMAKLRGEQEVILVHVEPEEPDERTHAKIRKELDALARAKTDAACTIRIELLVGDVDETLVHFAETEGSELAENLIVIAARSTRLSNVAIEPGTAGVRIGSSARQIIMRASMPVIVVRDPAPWLAFAKQERPLKVLIGVDDSAVCDLGIQWAHRLRMLGPVEIVLGAIYYPDDAEEYYGLEREGMADRVPAIESVLSRDLVRRFGGDGKDVIAAPRLGLGRIGDHLLELARELQVDAILVGTSQKTGFGSLGSVSTVIVNDVSQSVVCVPPQAHIQTITIPVLRAAMVATDLSQFSNRAIPYAFAAVEPDAEIHIVHIVDENAEVDVPEVVRTLLSLVPLGAKQKVSAHVVRGDDAAKAAAQTAARLGVDLIAICSHGRSGLTRALFGSVADRLLRATRLPVVVLRPG